MSSGPYPGRPVVAKLGARESYLGLTVVVPLIRILLVLSVLIFGSSHILQLNDVIKG